MSDTKKKGANLAPDLPQRPPIPATPEAAAAVAEQRGMNLAPDLSVLRKQVDASKRNYWLGCLPTCPVAAVHIRGISFSHVVEMLGQDAMGQAQRIARFGVVRALSAAQVRAVADALPSMVIRFHTSEEQARARFADGEGNMGGLIEDIGNPMQSREMAGTPMANRLVARHGHIVRIPTAEQRRVLEAQERFVPFVPTLNDEPLAAHIFMIPSSDRGDIIPPPLIETGLDLWDDEDSPPEQSEHVPSGGDASTLVAK